MKSKSVVLMVVSLGFGLIAAIGISQVMGNSGPGEATVERAQVLVAAKNLKHGDDLNEESVKIEHWPVEVIPEEAARDFEQIKHLKITTRLSKSLPIMMSDTANPKDMSRIEIPKGFKLCAIKVSAEETFNGLLQPGDKVDVIGVVTVRNDDPTSKNVKTKTISETFLKNIEVYTVDGRLNSAPREGGNAKNAIVGVLVTEKQSELIVLVQKVAKLRLVLRGDHEEDGDWDEFTDYSQFYDSVFGKSVEPTEEEQAYANSQFWTTRLYSGSESQEVKFEGNRRVTPQNEDSFEESLNDSNDYDQSEESDSDHEEDQYRGE